MAQEVITVVDDDPVMLETTRAVLSEEGYEVLSWSEGKTAYDFIRQHTPALAIVDLRMEHPQAGWITVHMLRLDPRTAHLPVLVCTGDADYVRANHRMLRENRCEVLLKPFSVDDLLGKVTAMLKLAPNQTGQPQPTTAEPAPTNRVARFTRAITQRCRNTIRRIVSRRSPE